MNIMKIEDNHILITVFECVDRVLYVSLAPFEFSARIWKTTATGKLGINTKKRIINLDFGSYRKLFSTKLSCCKCYISIDN